MDALAAAFVTILARLQRARGGLLGEALFPEPALGRSGSARNSCNEYEYGGQWPTLFGRHAPQLARRRFGHSLGRGWRCAIGAMWGRGAWKMDDRLGRGDRSRTSAQNIHVGRRCRCATRPHGQTRAPGGVGGRPSDHWSPSTTLRPRLAPLASPHGPLRRRCSRRGGSLDVLA